MTNIQFDNRIKALIRLNAEKKALEDKIEAIKSELKDEMGDMTVETKHFIIRNTYYEQKRVDSKLLEERHPKIYEECAVVSGHYRFSYKEK